MIDFPFYSGITLKYYDYVSTIAVDTENYQILLLMPLNSLDMVLLARCTSECHSL